jgi:hypothetical protein
MSAEGEFPAGGSMTRVKANSRNLFSIPTARPSMTYRFSEESIFLAKLIFLHILMQKRVPAYRDPGTPGLFGANL